MAGIKQLEEGETHEDEVYKGNRRPSQIVWQTLKNSS